MKIGIGIIFSILCAILVAFLLRIPDSNFDTPASVSETETVLREAPAAEDINCEQLMGNGALEHFSKNFTSIVYYGSDGTKTEISPDDPRLIRMFNLMGMSFDDYSIGYTQGCLSKESFERVYTDKRIRLECEFIDEVTDDPAKYVFMDDEMLYISYQDEFFEYQYQGIPLAIEYFPYFNHFPYQILTYCGF